MEIEQIKKILERYNEGQCTAAERKVIEQWFESINQHHTTHINEDNLQMELEAVRQSIEEQIRPVRRLPLRLWHYAVAAVTVLLAAGAWFFQSRHTPAIPGKAGKALAQATPAGNGFMLLSTPKGTTKRITLEDGSIVELNAASRLRYPVHFPEGQRELYLDEGEAFFEVARDPHRSFTVHAGQLSTTALGTSFNIRAYSREGKVTVALLTGKVKVDREQQPGTAAPMILLPSEQASYSSQFPRLVKTTFCRDEVTGWQEGSMVFKDATYEQVRAEIENRYGVVLINQSNKKEWNYTGSFRKESLQNVLETICLTESLSYTVNNDTILIR